MLSQNVRTTCKLVVQLFRTSQQNVTYRKYITFKERTIKFLEKTLENNICLQKIPLNMSQNVINDVANASISERLKMSNIYNEEEIEKKKLALHSLTELMYKQSMHILTHTVNKIDAECSEFVDIMSYYDIFKLLLFFTKNLPTKVIKMNFYNKVIPVLREGILNQVFSKEEIIFCIYFFGLSKINAANDIRMALQYLEFDELLLHEMCIITETAYKCGVKLLQTQIKYVEELIESEAKVLVANTNLFVPLCKVLRHAGPTTSFFPNNLNKEIVNRSEIYQMIPAVYILKLYKEMYLVEPTVLQRLVTDVMTRISLANQEFKDKCSFCKGKIYEPKYIDRFLWSICMLNYKLTKVELQEINTFLNSMEFNLFLKPQKLLRILLSLCILGYHPEAMIQKCIERNIFLKASESKCWKFKTSAHLLLHVIRIEAPNIELHTDLFPNVYVTLNIPKSIKILSEIISGLSKKMELQNVIINSPVKEIYIPGVSFDHLTLGSFHIDLLNDVTCLRNQKIPHGLMNLKLRLLQQLGYKSILIDEDIIKDTIAAVGNIEKFLYEVMYVK